MYPFQGQRCDVLSSQGHRPNVPHGHPLKVFGCSEWDGEELEPIWS